MDSLENLKKAYSLTLTLSIIALILTIILFVGLSIIYGQTFANGFRDSDVGLGVVKIVMALFGISAIISGIITISEKRFTSLNLNLEGFADWGEIKGLAAQFVGIIAICVGLALFYGVFFGS